MERMQQQLQVLGNELSTLKDEIVNIKSAHATLHQQSVESGTQHNQKFTEQYAMLQSLENKVDDMTRTLPSSEFGKPKALTEAKQVDVPKFAGSMTDGRQVFLKWSENVKDRVTLFDPKLAKTLMLMEQSPNADQPITEESSRSIGVTPPK